MHYLIKEVTLDPMLFGIATTFYALAISAGIWSFNLRKPEQLTPRTIRVQSDEWDVTCKGEVKWNRLKLERQG